MEMHCPDPSNCVSRTTDNQQKLVKLNVETDSSTFTHTFHQLASDILSCGTSCCTWPLNVAVSASFALNSGLSYHCCSRCWYVGHLVYPLMRQSSISATLYTGSTCRRKTHKKHQCTPERPIACNSLARLGQSPETMTGYQLQSWTWEDLNACHHRGMGPFGRPVLAVKLSS